MLSVPLVWFPLALLSQQKQKFTLSVKKSRSCLFSQGSNSGHEGLIENQGLDRLTGQPLVGLTHGCPALSNSTPGHPSSIMNFNAHNLILVCVFRESSEDNLYACKSRVLKAFTDIDDASSVAFWLHRDVDKAVLSTRLQENKGLDRDSWPKWRRIYLVRAQRWMSSQIFHFGSIWISWGC